MRTGGIGQCSTTSVDMMNLFLHITLSSDTVAAKVDMVVHSEVVPESKACMDNHIKVTACRHKHHTTNTHRLQPIQLDTVNSSNHSQLLGERVRQARACRITIAPDRLSRLNTSNSILGVLLAATAPCQILLVVLEVASKDRITASGNNSLVNTEVTMILFAALATLRSCLEALARLLELVLDRQSTICKDRRDFRRARTKTSKDTVGIRVI